MEVSPKKIIGFIVINVVVFATLVVGVQQASLFVNWISGITIESASKLFAVIETGIISFLANDLKIVFGVIFCASVITYDIFLLWRWFASFKFTTSKKCGECRKSLIREQRRTGDRILSMFLGVKRYRCVGCASEYLIFDRLSPSRSPEAKETPVGVRVKSD